MQKKRLHKDQENAVISGVLAGLADYFDHDPVLYRVIAIVFLVLTGFFPGLLIYIGAWLVMPSRGPIEVDYEVVE